MDGIFDTEEEKTETWPPKDEEAATVEIGRPAAAAPPDWEETLLKKSEDLCKRIKEEHKQLDGLDAGLQRLQTSLSTTSTKIDAARSMAAAAFAAAEAALASARND